MTETDVPISKRLKLRRLTSVRSVRRARARVAEAIADGWVNEDRGRALNICLADLRRDIVAELEVNRLPVLEERVQELGRLPPVVHQHAHLHVIQPASVSRNAQALDYAKTVPNRAPELSTEVRGDAA